MSRTEGAQDGGQGPLHLVLRIVKRPVEMVSTAVQTVSPEGYWDLSATEAIVCSVASAFFAAIWFTTAATTPLAILYTAATVSGILTTRWIVGADTPAARSCGRCLSVTADMIRIWDCFTTILSVCFGGRSEERRSGGAFGGGDPWRTPQRAGVSSASQGHSGTGRMLGRPTGRTGVHK